MKYIHELSTLLVVVAPVTASSIVYITDLPAFTSLAPCATSALGFAIQYLTGAKCPPGVSALQSCACSQDQNSAVVSSSISSDVLGSCGTTATEDVASASLVFSNYCNQGASNPFPPITNGITQYPWDLAAYSDLGPCASQAFSAVLGPLTAGDCPPAASALVSCACLKNQNALAVSASLNTQIGFSCGTTHTADVSSAQAVFAGYCGLNNGTSNFPTPSALAGSLTYYITDLPQYSSLAPCAGSAVSENVLYALTNGFGGDCPSDPTQLVSCACVKDGNFGWVSTNIMSGVSDSCGTTASADISSALAVFSYYCSAGKGLVTPKGVTNSVAITTPAGSGGSSAAATSNNGGGFFPTNTGGSSPTSSSSSGSGSGSTSSGGSGSNSGGSGTGTNKSTSSSNVPIGAIVGGTVGGVIFIALILFSGWRYRLRRLPPPHVANEAAPPHPPSTPPPYNGKPELASTTVTPLHPKVPKGGVLRKPIQSDVPVSPIEQEKPGELDVPPPPHRAEAPGTTNAAEVDGVVPVYYPEVHGQDRTPEMADREGTRTNPFEVDGQGDGGRRHELGSHANRGPYEMHAPWGGR